MKQNRLFIIITTLMLVFSSFAEEAKQDSYVTYFAGIEYLSTDKKISRCELTKRYRSLCRVTGVTGEKAKAFLAQFKNDPEKWQKFQASILDLFKT